MIARLGAVIGRGTAKDGRLRPATNEIDASWDSSGSMADQFSRAATADDLSVPCFRASDRGKSITIGNLSLVVNCFGLFGANAAFKMQQFADEQHHGWRIAGGYLSEAFWSYTNAVFLEILAIPEPTFAHHVEERAAGTIAGNRDYLRAHPRIAEQQRSH